MLPHNLSSPDIKTPTIAPMLL